MPQRYVLPATSENPALVIYLVDISYSMLKLLGEGSRISVVEKALQDVIKAMIRRSVKGSIVIPRYKIAVIAYNNDVYDFYHGVKTIDEVARIGTPNLFEVVNGKTDTNKGFSYALEVLKSELLNIQNCPAPLICHMTDGEYSGENPELVVKEIIRTTGTNDGPTLIENIFITDDLFKKTISDVTKWSGIRPTTKLDNDYAQILRSISSPIPKTYHANMLQAGIGLSENAVMLFPGESSDIVELGFQVSTTTPVAISRNSYQNVATSQRQAIVVFLLDISGSMGRIEGGKTRLEMVREAFFSTVTEMVQRSLRQGKILPRYRVALFCYANEVYDVYEGIKNIDEIAQLGVPNLEPQRGTNMAAGFRYVKYVLLREIEKIPADQLDEYPVPLVIHMTDGESRGEDPEPIIQEIQNISFPDGHVLVENIYISERIATKGGDISDWKGFSFSENLDDHFANKLLRMSSELPETYRLEINSRGYNLQSGAAMLFPGIHSNFMSLAFAMSSRSAVSGNVRKKKWEDD